MFKRPNFMGNDRRKNHPMQRLLDKNYSARLKITIFILSTFILTVAGIVLAIYTQSTLNQEWKEVLLVMLGAFIGSYGKVVDFWFNVERDREIIKRADYEDNGLKLDDEDNRVIVTSNNTEVSEDIDKCDRKG